MFSACRRQGDERPAAAIATSPESEAKFDGVRARWVDSTPKIRAGMRDELEKIMRELEAKGDGLEPIARAYLAVAWLEAGVPAAAEAVARPLVEGPPGVPNDLGVLVKGAAARRQGRSAEAIELLRPLVGKLIDVFARPILYEEITEAFIDQQRWDDAIVYAEGWLRSSSSGAPVEQKAVKQAVARVLSRIPQAVALRVLEAEGQLPPEARHSPDLIVILAARVDEGSTAVTVDAGGDVSLPVAAFDAEVVPLPTVMPTLAPIRFDPRTIALLVPASVPSLAATSSSIARAAAAVAAPSVGDVMHGDAGADSAMVSPSGHRLAVFDTLGTQLGLQKALDAAERDGAGVVVGGVTDAEANLLAALAQSHHLATVLLRRPTSPPAIVGGEKQAWISVGPSIDEEQKAVLAIAQTMSGESAIVEAASERPFVESTDLLRARCDTKPKTAGAAAFPVDAWRARKIANVVVLGDARCARRIAEEIGALKPATWKPTMLLAPDALEAAHFVLPVPRTILGAGLLPAGESAPPLLRALWIDQGGPVGWEGGLAHDAVLLATWALPGDLLPTSETAAREKARILTIGRLGGAKGELWTTSATGPEKSGSVPRSSTSKTVAAGSAVTPSWAP